MADSEQYSEEFEFESWIFFLDFSRIFQKSKNAEIDKKIAKNPKKILPQTLLNVAKNRLKETCVNFQKNRSCTFVFARS